MPLPPLLLALSLIAAVLQAPGGTAPLASPATIATQEQLDRCVALAGPRMRELVASAAESPPGGPVIDVTEFGAVGDGRSDDTAALRAALGAVPPSGGTLLLPAGVYRTGNLQIANKRNLLVLGSGARLRLAGAAPAGEYLGVQLVGTLDDITISNLAIEGDGIPEHRHAGIWSASGQSLSSLKILGNHVENVVLGISVNADLGGTIEGALIAGNELETIVGTLPGYGYGIHHANGSGNPSGVCIVNNTVTGSERHAIYQARGSGVAIVGNTIRHHREGVATGDIRPAISVARSAHVLVSDNLIEAFYDGGIDVEPGICGPAEATARDVAIAGNRFLGPLNNVPIATIGSRNTAEEGMVQDIVLDANVFERTQAPAVWIFPGNSADVRP